MAHVRNLALGALALTTACADPLADFDRLADVPLAQNAPEAGIIPADEAQPDVVGLITTIFGGGATETPAEPAAPETTETLDLPVVPETEDEVQSAAAAPTFLGGLLGGTTNATPAALPQIAPGTVLPYGELATVCGIAARNLGSAINTVSGYTTYDSQQGNAGPRTHYVTGFDDGCARQFTAALVLFGDVGTHEFLRYAPTHNGVPYSATDTAYEEIKGRFCGVSSGQPCGQRLEALGRTTAFLTIYPQYGNNGSWFEVLMHRGEVIATGFEGR